MVTVVRMTIATTIETAAERMTHVDSDNTRLPALCRDNRAETKVRGDGDVDADASDDCGRAWCSRPADILENMCSIT